MEKNYSTEERGFPTQAQIDQGQNSEAYMSPSFAGMHFSNEEWNALNQPLIEQFRTKQGTVVEDLFKGTPTLLLTTIGMCSGKTCVNSLMYTCDGRKYMVLASKLGVQKHSLWYSNLIAHPIVTIEVGSRRFQARAEVVEGRERDRLFKAHAARSPNFAEYQHAPTRIIPVVTLTEENVSGSRCHS